MLERNTKESVLVKQDNSLNDLSGITKKTLSLSYLLYGALRKYEIFHRIYKICLHLYIKPKTFLILTKSHICFKDPGYKNKGKEGEFPQEFTILYGEGGGKGSTRGVLRVCGSTGKTLQWSLLRKEKALQKR